MINSYQKIAIVGTGNVAWHLAPALESAECSVVEVYGRQPEKAQALANRLSQTQIKTDLNFSDSAAGPCLFWPYQTMQLQKWRNR